jgi:type I restriction enzyme M protein
MHILKTFYSLPTENWVGDSGTISTSPNAEAIRQWVIAELFSTYKYPSKWRESRLMFSEHNQGTLGAQLLLPGGEPFLAITVAENGKADVAEIALRTVLKDSPLIATGVSTDGTESGTVFLRRRFEKNAIDYVSDLEKYHKPAGPTSLPYSVNTTSPENKYRRLVPLTERIEHLFFELHSHIRDSDGLHADEALDELCKIIYAKLYDEEHPLENGITRLQRGLYGTTEELASSTRLLYKKANEYDLRVYRLKIPEYERSRGVFSEQIRLSCPAIARVITELESFSLSLSGSDVKGRAFQRVLAPTVRSGMGQYFTPEPVIRFMVDVAGPTASDLILDPFCGSAHFLSCCLDRVRNTCPDASNKIFHEFAFGKLHGIEKSDRMVRIAMTDMRLHGDGHSNVRCTDALLDMKNYSDIAPESFDLVLTNPPFGSLLNKETISRLGIFDLAKNKPSVPLEILGLERCIQFLRPGGKMGIVLPDGILTNRKSAYVRDWLSNNVKLRAIISLPIETFSPFGANIKTSIVFLRKWDRGEERSRNYHVALVRIDNVGYDAAGRKTSGADLSEAADALSLFLNQEGW